MRIRFIGLFLNAHQLCQTAIIIWSMVLAVLVSRLITRMQVMATSAVNIIRVQAGLLLPAAVTLRLSSIPATRREGSGMPTAPTSVCSDLMALQHQLLLLVQPLL